MKIYFSTWLFSSQPVRAHTQNQLTQLSFYIWSGSNKLKGKTEILTDKPKIIARSIHFLYRPYIAYLIKNIFVFYGGKRYKCLITYNNLGTTISVTGSGTRLEKSKGSSK